MHPVFNGVLGGLLAFLFAAGLWGLFGLLRGRFRFRRLGYDPVSDECDVLLKSPLVPAVSLIAFIPDASPASREFVRRLLEIHYGKHELVLVLDGPSEGEIGFWKEEFGLSVSSRAAEPALPSARIRCIYEPAGPLRMVLVSKERGGEADSLNAAINVARSPLIGLVAPGSEFRPDAFLWLVRAILEDPERTIAACGADPVPPQAGFAARIATLESVRMWLAGCGASVRWKSLPALSGGCMLLSREAIVLAGGFRAGHLELLSRLDRRARMSRNPSRIAFVPGPISYPRPARTIAELRKSTLADQQEIAGALRWPALASPGLSALFAARVLYPAAETAAYILTTIGLALGWTDFTWAALLLLASTGMGILQSAAAVLFRQLAGCQAFDPADLIKLIEAAIFENLGYRQLRNLWLIAGIFSRNPRPLHPSGNTLPGPNTPIRAGA
jgi:hypothetical protein